MWVTAGRIGPHDRDGFFSDPCPASNTLPPVEQASHLQPIDWADTTGSFAAICEVDR
jgi:hypothetical protein